MRMELFPIREMVHKVDQVGRREVDTVEDCPGQVNTKHVIVLLVSYAELIAKWRCFEHVLGCGTILEEVCSKAISFVT